MNSSEKKVIVAKSAGVCFGVDLALKTAEKATERYKGDLTGFGPLVHNQDVIQRLKKSGVETIDEMDAIQTKNTLIRAHGATLGQLEQFKNKGINVIDATCPLVKKPQNTAKKWSEEGKTVVLVGRPDHPEVKSVSSFAGDSCVVVSSSKEAHQLNLKSPIGVISQTTLRKETFDAVVAILIEKYGRENVAFQDTICFATKERQDEARELSQKVDAMIVIGGSNSSNTKKLVEVCSQGCDHVDYFTGVEDLKTRFPQYSSSVQTVGLTAGASTPLDVIEDISLILSERLGATRFAHDPSVQVGSEKQAILEWTEKNPESPELDSSL